MSVTKDYTLNWVPLISFRPGGYPLTYAGIPQLHKKQKMSDEYYRRTLSQFEIK